MPGSPLVSVNWLIPQTNHWERGMRTNSIANSVIAVSNDILPSTSVMMISHPTRGRFERNYPLTCPLLCLFVCPSFSSLRHCAFHPDYFALSVHGVRTFAWTSSILFLLPRLLISSYAATTPTITHDHNLGNHPMASSGDNSPPTDSAAATATYPPLFLMPDRNVVMMLLHS